MQLWSSFGSGLTGASPTLLLRYRTRVKNYSLIFRGYTLMQLGSSMAQAGLGTYREKYSLISWGMFFSDAVVVLIWLRLDWDLTNTAPQVEKYSLISRGNKLVKLWFLSGSGLTGGSPTLLHRYRTISWFSRRNVFLIHLWSSSGSGLTRVSPT